MPEGGPIAILTALEEELDGVRRSLPESAGLVSTATGDGPRRAASGAARFLERYHPSAVIGAGLAGALTPGLSVGDIIVSRRVRGEVGDIATPDPSLLRRGLAAGGATAATLVTVDRPIVLRAAKAVLAATAVGGEVLAADMESAAWAREASARGIPYVVVRVVSDTAEEELPAYLPDCIGPDGSIRRGEVVRRALLAPSSWGTLLRMRRRLHDCAEVLGAFLNAMELSGIVGAGLGCRRPPDGVSYCWGSPVGGRTDPARGRPQGPPLR